MIKVEFEVSDTQEPSLRDALELLGVAQATVTRTKTVTVTETINIGSIKEVAGTVQASATEAMGKLVFKASKYKHYPFVIDREASLSALGLSIEQLMDQKTKWVQGSPQARLRASFNSHIGHASYRRSVAKRKLNGRSQSVQA